MADKKTTKIWTPGKTIEANLDDCTKALNEGFIIKKYSFDKKKLDLFKIIWNGNFYWIRINYLNSTTIACDSSKYIETDSNLL